MHDEQSLVNEVHGQQANTMAGKIFPSEGIKVDRSFEMRVNGSEGESV